MDIILDKKPKMIINDDTMYQILCYFPILDHGEAQCIPEASFVFHFKKEHEFHYSIYKHECFIDKDTYGFRKELNRLSGGNATYPGREMIQEDAGDNTED